MNNNNATDEKSNEPEKVTVVFDSVNDAVFFLHTLGFLLANQNTGFHPAERNDLDVYTRVEHIGHFLQATSNGIYDALEKGAINGGRENA